MTNEMTHMTSVMKYYWKNSCIRRQYCYLLQYYTYI